ncbi:unnamed protein product [Prorocentrum cordatum]|uniref:Methyltransferase domain-containing protein n=1 Tax=Prorocentrum cordatum TaxID=2364126 RepID=A0ABN9RSL2_9DINO|nr:unnamed protein product [Polarella glacialis]
MVNDTDRNDFYYPGLAGRALESCDLRGKFVLDIGSGSGILSMMAARLGARRVVAVDENADLVRLARHNVSANGLADVVEVRHGLSTELELDEKADVLVTETMGTWMTCEGMVQWCEDARKRLLKEGAQVVPQRGVQYAVLVESEELAGLTSCWKPYRGIDLSAVMELQDTSSCLWTKRVGVKPSSLVYQELCEPFPLLEVDFGSTPFSAMPRTAENRPRMRAGRVHAVLDFWICEDAQGRQLSTDPRARRPAGVERRRARWCCGCDKVRVMGLRAGRCLGQWLPAGGGGAGRGRRQRRGRPALAAHPWARRASRPRPTHERQRPAAREVRVRLLRARRIRRLRRPGAVPRRAPGGPRGRVESGRRPWLHPLRCPARRRRCLGGPPARSPAAPAPRRVRRRGAAGDLAVRREPARGAPPRRPAGAARPRRRRRGRGEQRVTLF